MNEAKERNGGKKGKRTEEKNTEKRDERKGMHAGRLETSVERIRVKLAEADYCVRLLEKLIVSLKLLEERTSGTTERF